MAGKITIGFANLGVSKLESMGWKLITDGINRNARFGLFTQSGKPFYEGLVDFDSNINGLNDSIKIGNKELNPLAGKVKVDSQTLMGLGQSSAEVGVIALNYSHTVSLTQAPVQHGKSFSFNQEDNPWQGQVTYVSTGTEKQRSYFERAVHQAIQSLQRFVLVTPEMHKENVKIMGMSLNRSTQSGLQLNQVQLTVQEVLHLSQAQAWNNMKAQHGDSQDSGVLQPKSVTSLQEQTARKT
ncbi:hypothetical protein COMNV_00865 [Commensalibacter sp. Nvir]|uniref:hypothetical protein n=1 Tax=Commensalibacter sp. Nvir TaxID=3069817 RepID=UPI002D64068D|nr:hypothetical protein COMNV_00865 [Commensalibacter sp. Nvir]